MLEALQCHGHIGIDLSSTTNTAAEGGLETTIHWLLRYSERKDESSQQSSGAFAAAARAGQLSILTLLFNAPELCTWDQQCGIQACNNNHRAVLEWLRAHEYPWTMDYIRQAAVRGDLALLQWMRTQPEPWRWDS